MPRLGLARCWLRILLFGEIVASAQADEHANGEDDCCGYCGLGAKAVVVHNDRLALLIKYVNSNADNELKEPVVPRAEAVHYCCKHGLVIV